MLSATDPSRTFTAVLLELYEFDMIYVDPTSEAARQETPIYPILREIFRHHANRLSLLCHRALRANGDWDFTLLPVEGHTSSG